MIGLMITGAHRAGATVSVTDAYPDLFLKRKGRPPLFEAWARAAADCCTHIRVCVNENCAPVATTLLEKAGIKDHRLLITDKDLGAASFLYLIAAGLPAQEKLVLIPADCEPAGRTMSALLAEAASWQPADELHILASGDGRLLLVTTAGYLCEYIRLHEKSREFALAHACEELSFEERLTRIPAHLSVHLPVLKEEVLVTEQEPAVCCGLLRPASDDLPAAGKSSRLTRFATNVKVRYVDRALRYWRLNGTKKFMRRLLEKARRPGVRDFDYAAFKRLHDMTPEELNQQREEKFPENIKFSICIPLYKTEKIHLDELIQSVLAQTYENWELCLSDGSGLNSPLTGHLREWEAKDKRIRVLHHERALNISDNTNEALAVAKGDYLVFCDHDDLLAPEALYLCAKALAENSSLDILYSDEDKVTMNGKDFFMPHFKPDFNIDLLRSMNYICHLFVIRRSLQQRLGGLDAAFDGAQDYDFVLRATEQTDKIYHIPRVLYHWRAHPASTAENPESKRYAFEAGRRVVEAHYRRLGIPASVEHGPFAGLYHTRYSWPEKPMISILIPNKDHVEDLDKCIRAIEARSTWRNYEFIIIENNSTQPETFAYYEQLQRELPHARVLYYKGGFNYSAINNFGEKQARGEYLLLLNNDTELIADDCLEELMGYCMRADVGAVGCRLLYEDDTIQHAGVVIGFGGIAGHTFIGEKAHANGYFSRIICAQNYSAVTAAAMLVKRSAYRAVDGLDESFKVAFNDIDFCMKLGKAGYRIVYNPYATMHHYESKSRGLEDTPEKVARFHEEIVRFARKWWPQMCKGDPCYNVNLSLSRSDFGLRADDRETAPYLLRRMGILTPQDEQYLEEMLQHGE